MKSLTSNKIDKLPYQNLKKVSDLMFYEGSLLSHFTDNNNNNILYLWVDSNNSVNRWLIFKVTNEELANYLKKGNSLRDLVESDNSEFVFTADINEELEYQAINLFTKSNLSVLEEYIPEEDSYYSYEISSIYHPLLKPFEGSIYINEFPITTDKLETDEHIISLKDSIEYSVRLQQNRYFISYPKLNIELQTVDKKLISNLLSNEILNTFNVLMNSNKRTEGEEKSLNFLKELISEIKRK